MAFCVGHFISSVLACEQTKKNIQKKNTFFRTLIVFVGGFPYYYTLFHFDQKLGDQHEYCKPSNSDSIQTANNNQICGNTQQKQQDTDHKQVAIKSKNGQTNTTETHIVSKASIFTKNSRHRNSHRIGNALPSSPDTSISVGSIASTTVANRPANSVSANSKRLDKQTTDASITEILRTVTETRTVAQKETNNNNNNNNINLNSNRNISDLV